MSTRSPLVLAVAGLLAVPALTSCSGSGGLDGDWSVGDALAEVPVPDGDGFVYVQTADLERANELGDLDPESDTYFRDLVDGSDVNAPLPLVFSRFGRSEGVDVADVASFVNLQSGGDGGLEVLRMPDADLPGGGDDVAGLEARTDGDRVALADDAEALDAWADRDDTLADDEVFGAVADLLDGHDVYAAELNRTDPRSGPTRVFAVGQAVEGGDPVEYVVYSLGEGDDGDEVAADLEEKWDDTDAAQDGRIEVDEVEADRDAVVVRILPDDAGEAARGLQTGDFPFPS